MSESKTIDDGGLAFPAKRYQAVDMFIDPDGAARPTFADVDHPGMTLRDWFAGQALVSPYTHHDASPDKIAEWAYQIADAMIAVRKGGAA